ncbi:hypothetical protein BU16DRAFT_526262 [Lophium mytilinum]|uniref:MYND-type domain-containing protein n=1 Tax=Lophium mytilinum TaxID=390894 RepID=A0A6A6QXT7_9PEZI|nr:hypothetical protein BU16DRAFT_526262 [Lophium mytilinum]
MPLQPCTICNAPNANLCGRCKSTAYCSTECQQADWFIHRKLCRFFSKFLTPPGPNFRRAIFFPTAFQSGGPRLTWVEITPGSATQTGYDRPLYDDLLKIIPSESNSLGRGTTMVYGNRLRAGRNAHAIELTYRDVPVEIPENASIAMVGGSGWEPWYGPHIAMAKAGTPPYDPPHYQHITLVDFRDVVDYYAFYLPGHGSVSNRETDGGPPVARSMFASATGKVKGVRVNCRGDREVCGRAQFEVVDVSRRHPLFNVESDDPSDVTDCLEDGGVGVVRSLGAKPYPPDAAWKGTEALRENAVIDALFVGLQPKEPEDEGWACLWGEPRFRGKGSFLVVARDKQDLAIEEVEDLYNFSRDCILPYIPRPHLGDSEQERAIRKEIQDPTLIKLSTEARITLRVRKAFREKITYKAFAKYLDSDYEDSDEEEDSDEDE